LYTRATVRAPTPPYLDLPRPWLVAHRGDSEHAPENTLPAFERAVALGVDALEIDVHRSADDVVFVFHDDDTARITGAPGTIEARTRAEVAALDAGSSFTPDGGVTFPFRGRGVNIPPLAEVLARFPALRLSIDAKTADAALAGALARTIREAGAERRVVVGSFSDAQSRRLAALLPEACRFLPQAAAALHVLAARTGLPIPVSSLYHLAAVPRRHRGIEVVTPRTIAHFHRRGMPVHVWTVDEADEMRALLDLGVDGIITNRPALAKKVMER
jgi:glycerophosphoryl diester phosphodiesterase